jgi:carbamoylphosphate synthase large subunit
VGVIVQYGGQTPLKLARALEKAGVPIIGTTPDAIDQAEDRERFQKMLQELGLKQPPNRTARTPEEAIRLALEIGYPLVVRPSYVLGGRAMEIVQEQSQLERYMREAVKVSNESPVLLDRFLNDALEVDVDALCDNTGDVIIGGIMEHVEQAGVHSGDSACSLPPYSLSAKLQDELRDQTKQMARALGVVGLMNVQFAIQGKTVFVLEVNPRASRTVPFVSKACGLQLAKVAARCMIGTSLKAQGVTREIIPPFYSVKEAVFPFIKFPGVDTILGPEMKSTGEVMGVGATFAEAFLKSQLGASTKLPEGGRAFISVRKEDYNKVVEIAHALHDLGFDLVATKGTATALTANGLKVASVNKVAEGRPHIVDMIKNGDISFIVNVTEDKRAVADRIKGWITASKNNINAKNAPKFKQPNLIKYVFLSNHADAVYLDETDRRFYVVEASSDRLPKEDSWAFVQWRDGAGKAALLHYLLNLNTKDFNPTAPAPVSNSKEAMFEDNKSDLERWMDATVEELLHGKKYLISSEALAIRYREETGHSCSSKTITSALRVRGVTRLNKQARMSSGSKNRLFALKDAALYEVMTDKELGAAFSGQIFNK